MGCVKMKPARLTQALLGQPYLAEPYFSKKAQFKQKRHWDMLLKLVIYIYMVIYIYIYMVSYIRSLVAYQSYRNLGLCSSVSNQRFLSLLEREGTCTSLQFQRKATHVDGSVLTPERNSTESGNSNSKTRLSLPLVKPRKHHGTPRCISPQGST